MEEQKDELSFLGQQAHDRLMKKFKSLYVRGYTFTIFTDVFETDSDCTSFLDSLSVLDPDYLVFGWETCPTTGKEHIQGYFFWRNKKRATAIINLLWWTKLHLEAARKDPEANRSYCLGLTKGKTPNEVYIEHGEMPRQGNRSDLTAVCNEILDGKPLKKVYMENPENTLKYFRGFKLLADVAAHKLYEPPDVHETEHAGEAMQFLQEVYGCKPSEVFIQIISDAFGQYNMYTHQKYGILLNNGVDTDLQKQMFEAGFQVTARNGIQYAFKCVVFTKAPFLQKRK